MLLGLSPLVQRDHAAVVQAGGVEVAIGALARDWEDVDEDDRIKAAACYVLYNAAIAKSDRVAIAQRGGVELVGRRRRPNRRDCVNSN